jgi:hypothetical protein
LHDSQNLLVPAPCDYLGAREKQTMQSFVINTTEPGIFSQCAAAFKQAQAGVATSAVIGDEAISVTINFTPPDPSSNG